MKKRLTITIEEEVLELFKKIIRAEEVKTSFVVNMLIKDFNKLYKGDKDE